MAGRALTLVWEAGFLTGRGLLAYCPCPRKARGAGEMQGERRLHGKAGAWGRGIASWQLLHHNRDAASWSWAVVL